MDSSAPSQKTLEFSVRNILMLVPSAHRTAAGPMFTSRWSSDRKLECDEEPTTAEPTQRSEEEIHIIQDTDDIISTDRPRQADACTSPQGHLATDSRSVQSREFVDAVALTSTRSDVRYPWLHFEKRSPALASGMR